MRRMKKSYCEVLKNARETALVWSVNRLFDASSTDVDEIYRLKEEKEKKRLDSVQLIPQVAHKTVMRAMIGNSIITILKFLTYLRTGSPAMLSETVHTLVDTGNQAILLIGLREASKGSDDRHPYGYGRNAFFGH